MSNKTENKAILLALKQKLGYSDVASFELLNSEAPNSCAILDKKTSLVWKVARNKPAANPRLELRALEALPDGCEHISKHLDAGELETGDAKYFYLVFPYIEGSSLRNAIRERVSEARPFNLAEIKKIGDSVTKAICFLNDNDLVHQDVKPDNIIVKTDGLGVLIDLGIALFIQDSPKELKKLEGPYAYMSPEKLGVIGNGKFRQWAKLNFTSDLFSLGLILLEMATLRRVNGDLEPNLANLYKIEQIIPGLEISEEIKEYISPFLKASQFDRQKDVLQAAQLASPQESEDKLFRLWLHSSSKSVTFLDSFISDYAFKTKFGLVYKAEQASSEKNIEDIVKRGQAIKAKGGEFALDPCTYLQELDHNHHRGTRFFSYAGKFDVGQILYPPRFAPQGYLGSYVESVMSAQAEVGVTRYISPYLYLDGIESESVEANFAAWKKTSKFIVENKIEEPCYFALLISERLILARSELMELALIVANQRYAKNIYLRVESKRPQSQPMWDRTFMENLRDFIGFISQTKSVFLVGTGIEGIGYLNYGVSEVSTNPLFSQRKFSLEDKKSKRSGGVEPDPRYFVRKLLNEVLVPQEVDTPLAAYSDLIDIYNCTCGFCPKRDKDSLARHFLIQFEDMFKIISGESSAGTGKVEFVKWIERASDNYILIERKGVQFSAPTGSTFLSIWKQVF